jgi:cell division protein FtsW (lipid II flippase)
MFILFYVHNVHFDYLIFIIIIIIIVIIIIIKDELKLQRWTPWEDPLEYQEKIEAEM